MRLTECLCEYRQQINEYINAAWGGYEMVSLGVKYDITTLPGIAVLEDDQLLGALLYRIEGKECEIAALFSLVEKKGVGTLLVNAIVQKAKNEKFRRLWLITTNDNTKAIRFYQMHDFLLKAVHINSFANTRLLKPNEPEQGIDGIPILHEFEFEMILESNKTAEDEDRSTLKI